MSGWTPGPWVIGYRPAFSGDGYGYGGGVTVTVPDLLTIDLGEGSKKEEVARLIVEAPAMAEALEELVAATSIAINSTDNSHLSRRDNAIREARAILARIRGEKA